MEPLFALSVFSVDCSTVECPSIQQAVCPLDSYETQVRLTADGCCTLPTRCECLSGLCGFPVCEVGSAARIVSRGDGTPGRCCDVFECVNGMWGFSRSQRAHVCAGGGGRVRPSGSCLPQGGEYIQGLEVHSEALLKTHSAVKEAWEGIIIPSVGKRIWKM